MPERVPSESLLDSDTLRHGTNIFAQDRLAPVRSSTLVALCSFSNAQVVYQCLDFTGHQDGWRSSALCALTNEVDRIAVEQPYRQA
jgi:hypothetical protein